MSTIPITKRGAELLKEELQRLKAVERPAVINAISEARAQGDLSENAEYDAAKEKRAFLPFLIMTPFFFVAGASFAYFIAMPWALKFLLGFEGEVGGVTQEALPAIGNYMSFSMRFLFGFGVAFLLPVLLMVLVSLRRALLIRRACMPTALSPISPSISARGVRAATLSTTRMSMAPERIRLSAISRACSPLSGWLISRFSVSTPNASA